MRYLRESQIEAVGDGGGHAALPAFVCLRTSAAEATPLAAMMARADDALNSAENVAADLLGQGPLSEKERIQVVLESVAAPELAMALRSMMDTAADFQMSFDQDSHTHKSHCLCKSCALNAAFIEARAALDKAGL